MRHPAHFYLPLIAVIAIAGLGGCGGISSTRGGESQGNHLAVYASDRNRPSGQFDLYLYDLDSQAFRVLVNVNSTSPELNPTITSDGEFVAFQSDRGGSTGSDLYLYNRGAAALVALPGANSASDETEPAFSDDALKLAFVRTTASFERIKLLDGLADTLMALPGLDTTGAFNDWAPAPNATGTVIAFTSDRNGNPDVFVWERGVGVRDIAALRSDSTDFEPSLSGDGRYLFFASSRTGGMGGLDLWVYDLTASTLTALPLNTAANERHPASSRTGDVLIFQSDRAGSFGKYDVWNFQSSSGRVGQGNEESTTADEIQPALRWR